MAVTYMRKLEEEPETYDSNFTTLTKGINLEVHNWVLDHLNESKTILSLTSYKLKTSLFWSFNVKLGNISPTFIFNTSINFS